MAEYQNLFTQRAGHRAGATACRWARATARAPATSRFGPVLGLIGNAQIGPIYLGPLGLASLILGTLSINIMGFNMLAQVNWDIVQFVRQLFWLALEPPPPNTACACRP
jgi:photosynthetic reaction center M subunit